MLWFGHMARGLFSSTGDILGIEVAPQEVAKNYSPG